MKQARKLAISLSGMPVAAALILLMAFSGRKAAPQEDLKSKYAYKDFESAKKCRSCHPGIYEQWSQAMMSQAYTHHWDEIEYFELAVGHAEAKPELKDAADSTGRFLISINIKTTCSDFLRPLARRSQ